MTRHGFGLLVVAAALACAQAPPQTHLYRLQLPVAPSTAPAICEASMRTQLLVQDLHVAPAYDDVSMVYRESEYQLQHYDYHEWAAPPGQLVADVLADGYAASGSFARVERGYATSADAASPHVSLRGRVIALEEVDKDARRWVAHLRLELELLDGKTDERLWSRDFDVTHPLPERSPSGLAAATSSLLREVIDASAPAMVAAISGPCQTRR